MKRILAIDTGSSGGLAHASQDSAPLAYAMPDTDAAIVDLVRSLALDSDVVVIENPPKFCGPKLPGSSMYVMGYKYGLIVGAVVALQRPTVRVQPKAWQDGVGSTKGTQGAGWKRFLRSVAQERFPHLKVTLKTADALLIFDYARRNNL